MIKEEFVEWNYSNIFQNLERSFTGISYNNANYQNLFDIEACEISCFSEYLPYLEKLIKTPCQSVFSKNKGFVYNKFLVKPQSQRVSLAQYRRMIKGLPPSKVLGSNCIFNEPVYIEIISQIFDGGKFYVPWMSSIPREVLFIEEKIPFLHGHVLICGLGLGLYVHKICKNKNVSKITVIEKEKELIDFIGPKIIEKNPNTDLTIECGDAYEEILNFKADFGIIDIWLGNKDFRTDQKYNDCLEKINKNKNINKIYSWEE